MTDCENTPSIPDKTEDKVKIDKLPSAILEILLYDRTTGKNILWATDNYSSHGSAYKKDCPIEISPQELAVEDMYTPEAYLLFKRLEFKNIISTHLGCAISRIIL